MPGKTSWTLRLKIESRKKLDPQRLPTVEKNRVTHCDKERRGSYLLGRSIMRKTGRRKSQEGGKGGLPNLLMGAREEFRGTIEILQLYGDYKEIELTIKQNLEATQTEPFQKNSL